jgi:hypothetical protein
VAVPAVTAATMISAATHAAARLILVSAVDGATPADRRNAGPMRVDPLANGIHQ